MPRSAIPDEWERRKIGRKEKEVEGEGEKVKRFLKIMYLLIFVLKKMLQRLFLLFFFFFFFNIKVHNYICLKGFIQNFLSFLNMYSS